KGHTVRRREVVPRVDAAAEPNLVVTRESDRGQLAGHGDLDSAGADHFVEVTREQAPGGFPCNVQRADLAAGRGLKGKVQIAEHGDGRDRPLFQVLDVQVRCALPADGGPGRGAAGEAAEQVAQEPLHDNLLAAAAALGNSLGSLVPSALPSLQSSLRSAGK